MQYQIILFLFIALFKTLLFAQEVKAKWLEVTLVKDSRWPKRYGHGTVAFNNKMWVLGGYKNDVWSSSDGKKWKLITNSADWAERDEDHCVLVFNNKIWVLGGYGDSSFKNDVWSSSDGKKWKLITNSADWSRRTDHGAVVFNNKMWILGGDDEGGNGLGTIKLKNDVWSSSNGKDWTLVTSNASWSGRCDHRVVVFANKMWVLGGFDGKSFKNDVWSSSDGKKWDLITNNAAWSRRGHHGAVAFASKLWVLGGYGFRYFSNDVWSSSDGKKWDLVTNNAAWSGRESHGVIVFNKKIWILGGLDGNRKRKNDVWYWE